MRTKWHQWPVVLLKKIWQGIIFIQEWFRSLSQEEYQLTIWFYKETYLDAQGLKRITRSEPKQFFLKNVFKLSQTHVKGKDSNNKPFELKTTEPFDYNIVKLK